MTSPPGFAEVIGDPIAQSRSPAIHNFWLGKLGLAYDYRAALVTRAGLAEFVAQRRRDSAWRGCNVTMPLKLDAVMLADGASDSAIAAGAANLLLPKDGQLLAGNTDVGAVARLLGPRLQRDGAEAGITLLGSGGAARAVLVALHRLGVETVRIQARDLAVATKLAVEFGVGEPPRAFDAPVNTNGLINATPLGMAGVPAFPIDIAAMPAGGWVFDMVSDPAETPLLAAARGRGLATVDGLTMLVEQAADSFMLLFGHEAPRQFDADLMAMLRS